jgi:hypothetical protein
MYIYLKQVLRYLDHVMNNILLCKIWGFHEGDYEEYRLLGCYAVLLLWELTFRGNKAPPSSGWQKLVS